MQPFREWVESTTWLLGRYPRITAVMPPIIGLAGTVIGMVCAFRQIGLGVPGPDAAFEGILTAVRIPVFF